MLLLGWLVAGSPADPRVQVLFERGLPLRRESSGGRRGGGKANNVQGGLRFTLSAFAANAADTAACLPPFNVTAIAQHYNSLLQVRTLLLLRGLLLLLMQGLLLLLIRGLLLLLLLRGAAPAVNMLLLRVLLPLVLLVLPLASADAVYSVPGIHKRRLLIAVAARYGQIQNTLHACISSLPTLSVSIYLNLYIYSSMFISHL